MDGKREKSAYECGKWGIIMLQQTDSPRAALTAEGLTSKGLSPMPSKRTIPCVCDFCSTPYMAHPSNYGRFCSRSCFVAWRKSQRPVRTCLTCGTVFHPRPNQLANGGGKYCTHKCSAIGMTRPASERFWQYVDKSAECWEWVGGLSAGGYGQFSFNGRTRLAHRVSWQLHKGSIPDGLYVCHKCDNRRCVNPSHLFLGTGAENSYDMIVKGRNVPPPHRPGQESGAARLDNDAVREIRRLFEIGDVTKAELARRFGVGETTIWNVVNKRTWRNVD